MISATWAAVRRRRHRFEDEELDGWARLGRALNPDHPVAFTGTGYALALALTGTLFLGMIGTSIAQTQSGESSPDVPGWVWAQLFLAPYLCVVFWLFTTLLVGRVVLRPRMNMVTAGARLGLFVGNGSALGFLFGVLLTVPALPVDTTASRQTATLDPVVTVTVLSLSFGLIALVLWLIDQLAAVALSTPTPALGALAVTALTTLVGAFSAQHLAITPEAVSRRIVHSHREDVHTWVQSNGMSSLDDGGLDQIIDSLALPSVSWQWLLGVVVVLVLTVAILRTVDDERRRWTASASAP